MSGNWAPPLLPLGADFSPVYRSGLYYFNHPYLSSASNSSAAFAINSITYTPILVSKRTQVDRFAINVSTAVSGALARLGLYLNSSGLPGNLIFDAGEVNLSSNGTKEAVISATLDAGWYWAAGMLNNASGVPSITTGGNIFGMNHLFGNPFTPGTAVACCIRKTNHAFGTFPAIAQYDNPILYIYNQLPLFWYRIA